MKRNLLKWEIGGFIFIGLVGAALHFTFELSDFSSNVVAYFSAVNESTWEHLKMVFFPGLVFALIEYTYVRDEVNNYLVGKTVSLFVMPLVIVLGWYIYAPVVGRSIFPVDLILFYIAVGIGQIVSFRILSLPPLAERFRQLSFVGIIVLFIAFSTFTFYPPRLFLFEHLDLKNTEQFGILPYEENIRYFTRPPAQE